MKTSTSHSLSCAIALSAVACAAVILASSAMGDQPPRRSGEAAAPTDARRIQALASEVNRTLGLRKSRIARIDAPQAAGAAFRAEIPINGRALSVFFEPHSVRSDNFEIRYQMPDGRWVVDDQPDPPATYRGRIDGLPGARAAGALTDDGLTAYVRMPGGGEHFVEPLSFRFANAEVSEHVVYNRLDVISDGSTCGAIADEAARVADRTHAAHRAGAGPCDGEVCLAELGCDADHDYYFMFASATPTRIENIVNVVNMQYETQLQITHEISTILVRTSPASDPYTETEASSLWSEFRNEWGFNHADIQRDVAMLFTGRDLDGSIVGYASRGTVCSSQGYCLVQHRNDFAKMTDLCAHELGHTWDADHCTCPNNTMNAQITGANWFHHTDSIPEMAAYRDSITCLEPENPVLAPLPFEDDFPDPSFDTTLWPVTPGAQVNDFGVNEPSPPYSINVDEDDIAQSARMDASLYTNLVLSYMVQKGGGGDRPDVNEFLHVEYQNDQNQWLPLATYEGGGSSETQFSPASHPLPVDAQHNDLRIRFRADGTANGFGLDDWFIDDVVLSGQAALPGSFALTSPGDDATGVALSPTLSWEAAANSDSYNLLVDDDNDFSSPVIDETTTSTQVALTGDPLTPAKVYHWRVVASNIAGTTTSTPTSRSFTTQGNPPGVFVLVSPTAGEIIDTTTPLLSWSESSGAHAYDLIVDDDPAFASPAIDETDLDALSYQTTGGELADNTTYYWQVTARNAVDQTTSLPVGASFTIQTDPPGCEGDVNGDGSVTIPDITFVIFRLGDTGTPGQVEGDADGNGSVEIIDVTYVIFRLDTCQ